jgi:hypothetical protein
LANRAFSGGVRVVSAPPGCSLLLVNRACSVGVRVTSTASACGPVVGRYIDSAQPYCSSRERQQGVDVAERGHLLSPQRS